MTTTPDPVVEEQKLWASLEKSQAAGTFPVRFGRRRL